MSFLGGAPIFRTFHHSKFSPVDAGSVALAALHVHNRDNRNEEQLKVTTENGRGRLAHTSSQRRCLCTTGTIETRNNWKLQRRTDEEDWLILQAVQRGTIENRWHIYKPKNILLYYISIYTQQEAINTVLTANRRIERKTSNIYTYTRTQQYKNNRTTTSNRGTNQSRNQKVMKS